jgi:hypothetical protein
MTIRRVSDGPLPRVGQCFPDSTTNGIIHLGDGRLPQRAFKAPDRAHGQEPPGPLA